MADRRDLKDEMNRINELYQQKDLELRKVGGSDQQRQQMRDMLNAKKEKLIAEQGDSLQKLNAGTPIKIQDASVAGSKGMLDQSKLPDASKSRFSGLINKIGKKAAGVIPLAGAGYAALSGHPAMAAEELAGDVPVIGQAYEAIKSDSAGQSPEEEKMMLGEIQARKNYDASPASQDAKMAALKKIRGF
jgi:hypothetical protein